MSDQEKAPEENEEQKEQEEGDVEGHRAVSRAVSETDEPDVEGHRITTSRTVL